MEEEYEALLKNNTWSLQPLPAGRSPIGCKWIFRIKQNLDGCIQKYKARLVAKSFHQRAGLDYDEVFSLVVKPASIRLILFITLSKGWSIRQFDFKNAFLNGTLSEEVFMLQPEGFTSSNPNLVCHL